MSGQVHHHEEVITDSAPVSSDLTINPDTTDHNSTHNQLWHCVFLAQETCGECVEPRAPGLVRPTLIIYRPGRRPVDFVSPPVLLEVLNTDL